MKNYDNGFRHITVFGENQEQKEKLNNFLKENNYDHEETSDAVMVLTKEIIGTNEGINTHLKTFMTRVDEEEINQVEESVIDRICEKIDDNLDYNNIGKDIDNIIRDFEEEEDKKDIIKVKESAQNIYDMADQVLKLTEKR